MAYMVVYRSTGRRVPHTGTYRRKKSASKRVRDNNKHNSLKWAIKKSSRRRR